MPLPARQRAQQREQQLERRQEENWRNFGYNSEAGKLLHRLYGGSSKYRNIDYPQIHSKSKEVIRQEESHRKKWYAGRANQVDPRNESIRREREKSMLVPKVQRPKARSIAAIELVTKRKTKAEIETETNDVVEELSQYRPVPRPSVSTDIEKRRLQLSNQFKGGNVLPTTGTLKAIEGNVPLHLITGKVNQKVIKNFDDAKRAKKEREQAEKRKEKELLEQDFEDCNQEIQIIKEKINQIQKENNNSKARGLASLKHKLTVRISEMQRIDELLLELEKS